VVACCPQTIIVEEGIALIRTFLKAVDKRLSSNDPYFASEGVLSLQDETRSNNDANAVSTPLKIVLISHPFKNK
jgi:hypothetical protein